MGVICDTIEWAVLDWGSHRRHLVLLLVCLKRLNSVKTEVNAIYESLYIIIRRVCSEGLLGGWAVSKSDSNFISMLSRYVTTLCEAISGYISRLQPTNRINNILSALFDEEWLNCLWKPKVYSNLIRSLISICISLIFLLCWVLNCMSCLSTIALKVAGSIVPNDCDVKNWLG